MAARRLCLALSDAGAETRLLVQNVEGMEDALLLATADRWAAYRPRWDALPVLPWTRRRSPHWGNAWVNNGATRKSIRDFSPDITHLHWVNHGMLSVADVARLRGKMVWTLHDSWVFTGGCHSPQDCERFRQSCGKCPELGSHQRHDPSYRNWMRKKRIWDGVDFTVVTPSRWMSEMARSSSLLAGQRVETIANAVDLGIFLPENRSFARRALGLPPDIPLFLFGAHGAADDWNKGMDLWRAALPAVAEKLPDAEAVLAGVPKGAAGEGPFRIHELGVLRPERMALAMAAVNAVVVPSRMENLPNMVAESLACGTPVAAFSVGGIPEMIRPGETGFLARPYDTADLARGICELLAKGDAPREACTAFARAHYSPETIARYHLELYQSLSGAA